ncbi:MAG: macro domain-containing protein [Caldithrix sp.]|nr:MAG: macro domain-containing protein [Caldithrix sp.]
MQIEINHKILGLVAGDITEQESDAIVNPANSSLILGAGVAGAIRSKGGPTIQQACDKIGVCPVGGAALTTGGNLKARHVIHAVGPRMGEGDEDEKLKGATLSSLKVADDNGLKSIVFPAISTGIFGFPIERCADIMLSNSIDYLKRDTGLEKIIFCLYGQQAFDTFKITLERQATSI